MNPEVNIQDSIIRTLFESPGGAHWRDVLGSFPDLDFFVAGGCVRDELLKRDVNPKDFDIFIGGDGVEKVLKQLTHTGRLERGPFGSPRWHPDPNDSFYYDVIPIMDFVNGLWRCENITDVLNQFDFTANAVATNIRTGEFFDPQNGKRDIQRRIMRAVRFDYPSEPIAPRVALTRPEVVWFRILHYAALLELTIEPVTLNWLRANRHYTGKVDLFVSVFFPLHRGWAAALEPCTA